MEVAMPADRLKLADEPDETERALETARRELAAAKSAAPKLRVTFEGGLLLPRSQHTLLAAKGAILGATAVT
jgi:hypothetical protein